MYFLCTAQCNAVGDLDIPTALVEVNGDLLQLTHCTLRGLLLVDLIGANSDIYKCCLQSTSGIPATYNYVSSCATAQYSFSDRMLYYYL